MLSDSISILAATPPPRGPRLAQITQVGAQLLKDHFAARRIARLEDSLERAKRPPKLRLPPGVAACPASEPVPAVAAVTSALPASPVAAGTLVASLATYIQMSGTARAEFAERGGRLAQADFESLRPAARMAFIKSGGAIMASTAPARKIAPGAADPGAPPCKEQFAGTGASKTESQFDALSATEKMEFIRNNGRVV